ncbi:MAG: cytochrome c3 family protein [Armatimonadota bacterium]
MLRAFTLLVIVALWALACTPAFAGLYHVGSSLVCTDCHTMHYSMGHDYVGAQFTLVGASGSTVARLLKDNPNDLCLNCHNGTTFSPDVLGASANSMVRQGGGLNRESAPDAGYYEWTGHTLDSTRTAPGGTWANAERGLLCIDCHAPHGNATQYRNLRTSAIPGDTFDDKPLTFAAGALNDLSKDARLDASTFFTRYSTEGVQFNEPDSTQSAYANWCGSCHTDFSGSGGTPNMGGASGGNMGDDPWSRHPSADVNIGQGSSSDLAHFQSHTNRVKVMSSSGNWQSGTDLTPSCFSCHKAHGNKNPFGLIYMAGTGVVTEEGDNGQTMQDLCWQCHTP